MSFQNRSFGQLGKKTTNPQEQKALGKSNNTFTRRSVHERSGSLGEKSLLHQTRHIKQNSLSKLNEQIEDVILNKPLPNDPANELQANLMEFVTGKVSTYLAEVRSFVSNTFERISLLEHGRSLDDIQELLQNFKARKAFIDEQTQQMERSVLKFNFTFNSQKNHENLKTRQNDNPLVVKRFYSGQESSTNSQKQDVSNQKLEDIVSYLSQKNNFLLNRLQSSPVRATRMDFLSAESEKTSSRTSIEPRIFKSQQQSLTAQSSKKDLLQQIDCLGFINEIKGLKLQNKDLLTDLKNIQEKHKEAIKENDFLRNDNKNVWQDLDKTKSLFEIEKQMHLELKRLFNIKKSSSKKDHSPERTNNNNEDVQNMLKKFEEDNLLLDQLRKELKILQEKFTNEKTESDKINSFLKDLNKSLMNMRGQQNSQELLEAFGSEVDKLLRSVKSLETAKQLVENLEILQENMDFILKKINEQQNQDSAISELLKIIQIIQQKWNNDTEQLNDKESNEMKVISVLRQKLDNLIQNIFVKIESIQHLNAELLEKLNLRETELESKRKIQVSLKNQMQKVLRQISQNLGKKSYLDEGDLEADQVCQELQSRTDALKEENKRKDEQISELLEAKNKLEQEMLALKDLMDTELKILQKNKDKEVQDLSIALENIIKELDKSNFEKDDLKRQIQDQNNTITQFNAEIESLKQELRRTEQLYDTEIGQKSQMALNFEMLKTQLENNLSDKNQESVLLKSKLQEESERKEKEISNLEAERRNVASLLQNLESENFKIKEHLEDLEKQLIHYSTEKAALSGEFSKSQKAVEINTELYQQALREIEQLKLQKDDVESRYKHVEEENKIFATTLGDSEGHVKTLMEKLSAKEMALNKIAIEIQTLQEERASFEETSSNLSKELDALRVLQEELQTELRKNQTANAQLIKEVETLENHLKEEQSKRAASEENLSREYVTIQTLENMSQQFKEQVESLKIQLKEKIEEIISSETRYKETLSNLSKESDALKALKEEQVIELNKVRTLNAQEVNKLKQEYEKETASLKMKLEEKERALSDLSKKLEEKTTEFNKMQASKTQELEFLTSQITQIEDEKASFKNIHEEALTKISGELAATMTLKEELENELSRTPTLIKNTEMQFRKEIEILESRLKEEHETQLSKIQIISAQELKKAKEEFEKDIESLKVELEEKTTEFNKMQASKTQELEFLKSEVESEKISSKTLYKETFAKISTELAAMITAKQELENELTQTQAALETAEIQFRKQIETLKNRFKEEQEMSAREVGSLKIQLAEKEDQRVSSERALSDLSKELEEKIVEFNKLKAQELESLKSQLRELESEKISSKSLSETTMSKLSSELAAMITSKQELETELNRIKTTMENRLKEDQEMSTQEMQTLRIQLAEKEDQRVSSERALSDLSKELEEKILEFNKLQTLKTQELEFLKTQLKEIDDEKAFSKTLHEEALTKISKDLAASKGEFETELNRIKTTMENRVKEEQEMSTQEIQTLRIQLAEKEDQRVSSERALSDLSKELEEKIIEFNKIQLSSAQLKINIEVLEIQLKEEKEQVIASNVVSEELRLKLHKIEISNAQEIESLRLQLEEEENKIISSEAFFEEQTNIHNETVANLSNELAALKLMKDSEINQIEDVKQKFEEEIESLETRLREEQNKRNSYEETLSELSKQLASLKELEGKAATAVNFQEKFEKDIESLEAQLREEKDKRISAEALYEEENKIHEEMVLELSKEVETLKKQKSTPPSQIKPLETTETQTDFDVILAQKILAFLEACVQQTLHHTKTIYQGIESTTARDVEFTFYTAFKEIIESNHNMINKLCDVKFLELNLQNDAPAAFSEIFAKLNQSLEQNQKAKNLCNDLERISCAGSPISLQLHRMRSYQEENHSAVYDPRNLDMSGSISKFESSFMDIAAQHGADLEDSSSQKDEALKSLESKIDILNMSHQKIAEENNLLKRNVENTSKVQGQLRVANDKFAIEYDKLVEELKDRETDEERFALQIKILKKELEETRSRLAQSEGANEREHLKKILVKFLDTIFRAKQTKETAEMLKIICSMLFCSEAEKNKLLELFNRSIPKKSNSLLKVFS